MTPGRMLKNAHLRRPPHPSSLQRTCKYASLLRISGSLHLSIFEHPDRNHFFGKLLDAGPKGRGFPKGPLRVKFL